jgi:hypothetical protein
MQSVSDGLCRWVERNDGIYEFVFEQTGREAIDAWAGQLEELQLAGKWYGKAQVCVLLDVRHVELPVRYLFECLSDYNRAYRNLIPPHVRLAYIHKPETIILDIYRMFAELMSTPCTAEFFVADRYAEAIKWLLVAES